MKIGGVEVKGPAEEVLVLPRPTAEDIVFRARAVLDMTHFNAMCPEPKPRKMIVAGGVKEDDRSPSYLADCQKHAQLRFAYIAIKSLEPSDIEWETVVMDKPDTWENWEKELRDAGLSSIEVNRVVICVMQANSLDEGKLEAARESFLRGLEVPSEKSSGPETEPETTPSGEPAPA